MFRLYFSVFWNKQTFLTHGNGNNNTHAREGTATMKIPLVLLACGALIAGIFPFSRYVTSDGIPLETHLDPLFSLTPIVLALSGILIAAVLYKKQNNRAANIAASIGGLYNIIYNKFYIDEVYLFITRKVIFNLIAKPASWFDRNVVDGTMNSIALTTEKISRSIKGMQSGKVQSYAIYFFGGIVGLILIFIYWWK
jgi:NADH-quinone oxidoreductase subunit L